MEKMRYLTHNFLSLGLAICLVIWPIYAFSQNQPSAKGSFLKERKEASEQTLFEKMSNHKVLGERIKNCQKYFIDTRGVHAEKERLANCVWEGATGNDGSEIIKKLNGEEKEKYYIDLGLNKKGGALKKEVKEKTYIGVEGVGIDKKIKEPQDSALNALSNYLSKKLKDHFLKDLTEEQKKKGVLIDHASFNKIYKTRISKNIISSISSYCLNATPEGFLHYSPYDKKNLDPENLIQKNRKANLKKLNEFHESEKKDVNKAFLHWSKCLKQIKYICRQQKLYKNETDEEKEALKKRLVTWYGDRSDDTQNKSDFDYTSDTACLVNSTIKGLRRVLMKVKDIEKDYKESGKGGYGFKDSGIEVLEAKDLDGATSLTSGEFEKSGFKEESAKMAENLEKNCRENKATNECLNYVNIGKSAQSEDAAFLEYKTRLDGLQQKLDNLDEEAVKKYLKENKYIDKNTEQSLTEDQLLKIQEEMKAEYENEKKALISRMNRKIKGRSVQSSEGNDLEIDFKKSEETFEQIEVGLRSRAKEYTELLHFNNIVSGFLDITKKEDQGDTEKERVKISNIRTIKREMKSLAKGTLYESEEGEEGVRSAVGPKRKPSEDEKPLEELEKRLKKSGGSKDSKNNTDLGMNVEDISDKILQYDTIEKAKERNDTDTPSP